VVIFIVPAELVSAVLTVGELPAVALKPAVLQHGFAIDDGAGGGVETADIVDNAVGVNKAVMVLVVNTGAVIVRRYCPATIEARD